MSTNRPVAALVSAVAGAASALAALRGASAQTAGEPARLAVAIEVSTLPACPAARFQRALETRVRRAFEVRAGAGATLRVTIAVAGTEELEANATFTGASGKAARTVRGTCEAITSALALVATTWLEAEAAPEGNPPDAPARPPAEQTANPASPRAESPAAEQPPTAPAPRKRLSFGAHGIANLGLVGGPAGGAALSLAYETPRFELRGGPRGTLGGETGEAGRARFAWLTVGLEGCVHALTGPRVRLAGCARLEPGYFHASFGGVDRDLPWLALGAGGRLGWLLGPVRLELEGLATVPVSGYRISPTAATLVPFRTLVPALAAGIMVPFL